jgi:hypothetical protein
LTQWTQGIHGAADALIHAHPPAKYWKRHILRSFPCKHQTPKSRLQSNKRCP